MNNNKGDTQMNRFKLYLNDTNIEHQKECIKILFKHFNGTYRNTYNGNLEVIIEEKASTSGRPKKKLPGVDVLRAEKKEMTFEQMCNKYGVCRTTLYKILKSGDLHE